VKPIFGLATGFSGCSRRDAGSTKRSNRCNLRISMDVTFAGSAVDRGNDERFDAEDRRKTVLPVQLGMSSDRGKVIPEMSEVDIGIDHKNAVPPVM
jgi:hypothetical protein